MKELIVDKQIVQIDDEEFDLVSKYKWRLLKGKYTYYVIAHNKVDNKDTTLYLHRLVFGNLDENSIDHIDGNPSNNVISNLRCINHNQNLLNIKPRSTNKSGFLGISWDKKQNNWVAALSYKGKRVFRKHYTDIAQAITELDKEREVRLNVNSKC